MTAKWTIADDSAVPPLNLTPRSSAPSSPAANDIYLDDGTNTGTGEHGFRQYDGAAWFDLNSPQHRLVYNNSGSTIATETVVYGSDFNVSEGLIEIEPTDRDVSGAEIGCGITQASIANGASGYVLQSGIATYPTTGMTVGDRLYISSTAGALTNTRPTSGIVQEFACVMKVGASGVGLINIGHGTTDRLDQAETLENKTLGDLILGDGTELTIATGAVTIITARQTIDTEADAASDDLDTISGLAAGQSCVLSANNTARTVVIKNGTDNIITTNGADITLDETYKLVFAISLDGTNVHVAPLFDTSAAAATTAQLMLTAAGATSPTTNGAADGNIETTTNAVIVPTKDFDDTTDEYVQWAIPMPSTWDGSTITATFYWSATAGTASAAETVTWAIQGVGFANDDALDTAFGTAQTVSDTWIADEDLHVSSATSACTIAGSPAAGELVVFRVYRDVSADDMVGDAQLISVNITYGLA